MYISWIYLMYNRFKETLKIYFSPRYEDNIVYYVLVIPGVILYSLFDPDISVSRNSPSFYLLTIPSTIVIVAGFVIYLFTKFRNTVSEDNSFLYKALWHTGSILLGSVFAIYAAISSNQPIENSTIYIFFIFGGYFYFGILLILYQKYINQEIFSDLSQKSVLINGFYYQNLKNKSNLEKFKILILKINSYIRGAIWYRKSYYLGISFNLIWSLFIKIFKVFIILVISLTFLVFILLLLLYPITIYLLITEGITQTNSSAFLGLSAFIITLSVYFILIYRDDIWPRYFGKGTLLFFMVHLAMGLKRRPYLWPEIEYDSEHKLKSEKIISFAYWDRIIELALFVIAFYFFTIYILEFIGISVKGDLDLFIRILTPFFALNILYCFWVLEDLNVEILEENTDSMFGFLDFIKLTKNSVQISGLIYIISNFLINSPSTPIIVAPTFDIPILGIILNIMSFFLIEMIKPFYAFIINFSAALGQLIIYTGAIGFFSWVYVRGLRKNYENHLHHWIKEIEIKNLKQNHIQDGHD